VIYQVRIARDAERDIAALQTSVVPRVFKAIKALGENPRPPGCKKLKGIQAESWRIRVGAYRILYLIDDWRCAKWDIERISIADPHW